MIDDPLDQVFESGSEQDLGLVRCVVYDDLFDSCGCLVGGAVRDDLLGDNNLFDLLLSLGLENGLLLLVSDELDLGFLGLDRRDGVLVALELAPVAGQLEESLNLRARLRANAQPVLGTLGVDLDERGLLGGVVLTDLLDRTTVALGARVGDDDAVVGGADLAHALETDLDSHNSPV